MRDCVVQVCELFMNDAIPMPARKVSMSPSSRKMAADLPPSSSVIRRISRPHSAPMIRPVAVDPVNAILSTSGWETSAAPAPRSARTMLSTPGGSPASWAASPIT